MSDFSFRKFYSSGVLLALMLLTNMSFSQWKTNGLATSISQYCFELTPGTTFGSITYTSAIDLNAAFEIKSRLDFGASDGDSEGIAFFLYHDSILNNTISQSTFGMAGIDTLFTVEFDAHRSNGSDPVADHIGVFSSDHFNHVGAGNLLTNDLPQLENGNFHNVVFRWTPNSGNPDSSLFQIQFNCDSIFDVYIDLKDSVFFGQQNVFFGFSSHTTTGARNYNYRVCLDYSTLSEALTDTIICPEDSIQIIPPYYGETFVWSPNYAISSTSAHSPIFSPDTTTTYELTVIDSCGDTTIHDDFTITVNPMSVQITPIAGNICALDTIGLIPNVSGGFALDYQFYWSDGYWDSINTVVPTQSRSYIVTVEDTVFCQAIDTITLQVDTLPAFDIGADRPICDGDSIVLNMGAGLNYSYSWDPTGDTTQTLVVDSSMFVIAALTDGNNCTRKDTANFTWIALPQVNLGNDTAICQGDNVFLDAGNGWQSYFWSPPGDSTQTIFADSSLTYSVTVTNQNQCEGVDSINIHVDTIPVINIGVDTAICNGETLTVDAGAHYQAYVWSGGQFNQVATFTTTGTINLVVVDSNGCQGTDSRDLVVDTLPQIDLGPDTSICDLDSMFLFSYSGLFTHFWNGDSTITDDTLKIDTAGTYIITLIDSNFCVGTDTFNLNVDTLPVVDLGPDTNLCLGLQVILDAGLGNATYTWINNASNTNNLTIDTSNTYWVEVIDSNGCMGSDTMIFLTDSLPVVNLGNDTAICIGDNITFDAGAGYSFYQWNNGPNTQTITVDSAFIYTVSVTTQAGCPGADTIELFIDPLPIVNLGPDRALCIGAPISETLDAGPNFVDYSWSTGNAGPEATNRTETVNTQGTFRVTVTDINGCQNTDTINVTAVHLPSVDIGLDTAYCEGDDFTFLMNTGSGFIKHIWFDLNRTPPNDTVSKSGQILLVDTAGVYVVEITELFNNRECINRDTVNVIEMPLPDIGITGESTYCENEIFNFTLTAVSRPGYTYSWNTGAATNSINISDFGTYTVSVTNDTTGCNTAESHRVVRSLLPIIDLSGDSLVCEGRPIKIDAFNTGYTYRWIQVFEDTTILLSFDSVLTAVDSGLYRVELDNGYCEYKDSTFVRYDVFPRVYLGENTKLCQGDTLVLNATFEDSDVDYLWMDGARDSVYYARFSGTYSVEVSNGCGVDITNISLEFEDCSRIWVPNAFTPNDDGDNDYFRAYSLEDFFEYRLDVVDQWGNVIYSATEIEREWDGNSFDGSPMPVGTYVWKITYKSQFEFGYEGAPTRTLTGRVNLIR